MYLFYEISTDVTVRESNLGGRTLGQGTVGRRLQIRVDSRSGDPHRVDSRSGDPHRVDSRPFGHRLQVGYKTEYETVTTNPVTGFKEHSLVYTWVRRPMMLAMVPVSDVPDVFATIADSIPDTLNLDSFLGYFKRTWISGVSGRRARFPRETWNQTDRVETGDRHGKKRWVGKDAAMKRIVGYYHLYKNRVTEFLDELAQL
ncbi:hypothetical protein ACHWQZ_G016862 [Mnemiopsis leidyi]